MVAVRYAKELSDYEQAFVAFVDANGLPSEWFEISDHIALKCADVEGYARACAEIEGGVWEIELDGRLLGSAQLTSPLTVAGYRFNWIEIMQPRPGKESDAGFVEHTEFYVDDFDMVTQWLTEQAIAYELQKNPGHRWINIVIDDQGREIKLNNKVLADVVVWERENGHLHRRVV